MALLLAALDVRVNLLSKEELGHVVIYVHSCEGGWECDVLLMLNVDPIFGGIGALATGIARQGLGGCNELVRLGYCPHVINMTLKVLG